MTYTKISRRLLFWSAAIIGSTSVLGIFRFGGVSPTLTASFYVALIAATSAQVLLKSLNNAADQGAGYVTGSHSLQAIEWAAIAVPVLYLGIDLASVHHFIQRTSVNGVETTLAAYNPDLYPTFKEISVDPGTFPGDTREFAGIEFVWCPPGEVEIGSRMNRDEICETIGCDLTNPTEFDGEHPPKTYWVDRGFWISKHETTRKTWREVMGSEPWAASSETSGLMEDSNWPATHLNWFMIEEFLNKLYAQKGLLAGLPSEELWEYACKAGSTTSFSFGDDINQLGEYAWYSENSGASLHEVGLKKPNAWGLYDMHGNAAEYTGTLFDNSGIRIPDDQESSDIHEIAVRGGDVALDVYYLRSAQRTGVPPDFQDVRLGFRIMVPVNTSTY